MEDLGDIDITYSRAPLQTEIEVFESLLPQLLESDLGRWALIHDTEFRGAFDTQNDAIKVGYQTYGNVLFLTRQILEHQPIMFYGFADAA